jgi:hypothetical protein
VDGANELLGRISASWRTAVLKNPNMKKSFKREAWKNITIYCGVEQW